MANNKNKLSQKKNLSSMQVIKTLQILLQGDYTMNELIEQLNANESEPIFNNSVVSKYINTCRYCGIEIPKIHNKYFVTYSKFIYYVCVILEAYVVKRGYYLWQQ